MPSFPKHYAIPHDGKVVAVAAENREQLRRLRTELELLRRTARRADIQRIPLGRPADTGCPLDDKKELQQILCDAHHPLVAEMIAHIDRDFSDLRKEIMMSVVNEEAENIVQAAAESGVLEETSPASNENGTGESSLPLEEALAQAEEEIAKVAGVEPTKPDNDATTTPEPIAETCTSEEEAMAEEVPPEPIGDAPGVQTEPPVETYDVPAEGTQQVSAPQLEPFEDTCSPQAEPAEQEPDMKIESNDVARDSQGRPSGAPPDDTMHTPDRAERVVEEIEAGIRKLASLLSTEVQGQWTKAGRALDEIIAKRKTFDESRDEVQTMLDEMNRMKEEISLARDDAEVARSEAKRFREDTRRAKERADRSAEAAERAADAANEEAQAAQNCTATAP